jgi:HAD superfamily hydrolase (TIGR01509 family)
MGRIAAVILDVDGTLVDSNDAHAHAWVEALAEAGHAVPFERVRPLIGKGGDKLLPEVAGLSDEHGPGAQVAKRRSQIFQERYLSQLKPFPRVRELLQRMKQDGLALAIASSAKEDELGPLLEKAGVQDLVPVRTSSDDAENSKPDPDIVAAALARLGCPPAAAVMVGDTPYDIEAAARAGLRTIAFRCGGWQDDRLGLAAEVYDGPAQLLERWDASLLGRDR